MTFNNIEPSNDEAQEKAWNDETKRTQDEIQQLKQAKESQNPAQQVDDIFKRLNGTK